MIYLNCYDLVKNIALDLDIVDDRDLIDDFVQELDITPIYTVRQIVREINNCNKFLFSLLLPSIPGAFLNSKAAACVSSVFTLPADFGKVTAFKDTNAKNCYEYHPRDVTPSATGNTRIYYRKGNTFVIEKTSITDSYTLWYEKQARDLDMGKASAGGALSITLATSAKKIIDYYNEMTLENITKDWTDVIDDYTAVRVATISETAAADDYYGIVSDLPEHFRFLILPRAVVMLKDYYSVSKEKSTDAERQNYIEALTETLRSYAGQSINLPPKDFDYFRPAEVIASYRAERNK